MLQALETPGEQHCRPVLLGAPTPMSAPAPTGLSPEMCVPLLKQSHPVNFSIEMFPELTKMCAEGHLAAALQQRTARHNPDLPRHEAGSPKAEAATHTDMKDAQGRQRARREEKETHPRLCVCSLSPGSPFFPEGMKAHLNKGRAKTVLPHSHHSPQMSLHRNKPPRTPA